MSIQLKDEQPLSVPAACEDEIPKFLGAPISAQTLYRWISKGLVAGDGTRIRLEAVKVGRRMCLTQEAIERFFDELTRRSLGNRNTEHSPPAETIAQLKADGLWPT